LAGESSRRISRQHDVARDNLSTGENLHPTVATTKAGLFRKRRDNQGELYGGNRSPAAVIAARSCTRVRRTANLTVHSIHDEIYLRLKTATLRSGCFRGRISQNGGRRKKLAGREGCDRELRPAENRAKHFNSSTHSSGGNTSATLLLRPRDIQGRVWNHGADPRTPWRIFAAHHRGARTIRRQVRRGSSK